MLRIILITIFIISSSVSITADDNNAYFDLMGEADKAIKDGKWADAETFLRKALRLDPANPSNVLLLSNLGMVQFYDGREADAVNTLSEAHSIAPASVTILLNRARVFTSTGKKDMAIADYSEVIRLDSTLVEPRFYRAILNLDKGDIKNAQADIDTLALRHPSDRLTHIAQATILMQTGKYAEAIPHLSNAIRQQEDASYYGSRALCYLMTDDPASASEDIAKGLEIDPTDGDLYLYRALLNKVRFRPDDAKADGEKAVKFGANPERVRLLLQ